MMAYLEIMWNAISNLLTDYGYISVFLSSFLSATIIPMASEAFVVAMIKVTEDSFWKIIIVATAGNFVGACTTYYIGSKGTDHVLFKYFSPSEKEFKKAQDLFDKYGAYVLLLSWLPLAGDAFVFFAGVLKYEFVKFSIFTFLGKMIRYIFIAYTAGLIFG